MEDQEKTKVKLTELLNSLIDNTNAHTNRLYELNAICTELYQRLKVIENQLNILPIEESIQLMHINKGENNDKDIL